MPNYAEETDIEALLSIVIDANSRPTSTQLLTWLNTADKMINTEMKASSNISDTYGDLKVIAIKLVHKMFINMLAFSHPAEYEPIELELSEEDKRIIHYVHSIWASKHWEIGD